MTVGVAAGALAAVCAATLCCCGGAPGAAGRDGGGRDAGGRDGGGSAPLRLMTYNIKHAQLSSLSAIAAVINAQHPDVVALQEVDDGTDRSGGVDQTAMLAELTGLHGHFSAAIPWDGGLFGPALLSRFPIVSVTQYPLTSNEEPRVVAIAKLRTGPGQELVIAYTHFDLIAADRVTEAKEVLDHTSGIPRLVVMGDLNDVPTAPSVSALSARFSDAWAEAGRGAGYTDPASTPTRRIDYILPGPAWPRATGAAVIHSPDSDHDPVVAELPWR